MTTETKMTKMEEILKLLDEGLTRTEFEDAFKIVLDTIDKLRKDNGSEFDQMHQAITALSAKLKADNGDDVAGIRKECQQMMTQMMSENTSNMNFLKDTAGRLRAGKDGKDGANPDPADVVPLVLAQLPPDVEETGDQIIEKINSAETLISKDSVEGLADLEKGVEEVKKRPLGAFGRSLLQFFVNGSKKGAIQYLNLIAGSGVTLTYNNAYGRNDVTISAAGGAFSILTATGTIDDSNKVFTFVSTPTIVIVNGASYINGAGVTIVGTTATLDNVVGTGGNLYGIG